MSEETIFAIALQQPGPRERAAFLAEACAGDAVLRGRVEALLRSHEQAGSFLQEPAVSRPAHEELAPGEAPASEPCPLAEGPGSLVGPYKPLEPIGEGGMGVVWMAEQQEPVRRLVALKVIKAGMDTRQVIARFEAERQALALMDHPNIAKVLDAGATETGRPYFVMELVKGIPITTYCDEQRLTPRQRLELFIPVCEAVQHAHQKGVIHRDLKPSNVLVACYDGKPVPKVIDFGVAKATGQKLTERTLVTGFGNLVGTLEYMSPEQAEFNAIDVDTRSDLYSLGVLLYELLTGTTPLTRQRLKETALADVLRTIREEEPPRPSTRLSASKELMVMISAQRQMGPLQLTRLVRGELDWIVMKALEKDRNRRYDTAGALADDVQRYLHDEPVHAYPPSLGYRLQKVVRRHQGKVAAVAVMLALLVAGVAASTWQAVRATRAERATGAALAAERAAQRHTRAALDALTDDVIERLLAKQPELGNEEKAFLRKVLAFYEDFTRELGDTADARYLRAAGYFKVALLRARLGERDQAVAGFRQAQAEFEQLVADFPAVPVYRDKLARSLGYLGDNLRFLGNVREAEAACQQAVDLTEALVAEIPAERVYRLALVHHYKSLIIALSELGKHAAAEMVGRQALAACERLATEFPKEPVYRRELAISYNNLGRVLQIVRRHPEAETAFRQSIAVAEQLVAEVPAVPGYQEDLARTNNNLGEMLRDQGKYAEAEAAFRQALDLDERLVADYPAVPSYREALVGNQNNCGYLCILQHRPAEALDWYDRALARLQPLRQHEPRDVYVRKNLRNAHGGRAKALDALKRHTEAQSDWQWALELSPSADKPWIQLSRDQGWVRAGRVAEAVADADMLTKDPATPGSTLYEAAGVYALAAAAVANDATQRTAYADRALALLCRARAAGYFKGPGRVEHLKQDTDLAVLRPRQDFQQLVVELEAAAMM